MGNGNGSVVIQILIILLVSLGIGYAGSANGVALFGLPGVMVMVGFAFLVQWIAFVPAFLEQTEKFYDLTGSLTYISVMILCMAFAPHLGERSLLIGALVMIWAIRLGTFLFKRIAQDGRDVRFDKLKPSFFLFLRTWTLQGMWVSLTACAAMVAILSANQAPLDIFALVGGLVWVAGFAIEVISDRQKREFKQDPANNGRFINTGLWARSRHPNYFGEITLWTGILIIAIPQLAGAQWVAVISPIFVYWLLAKISGIPMLEARADKTWGEEEEYQAYKANTPVLVPKLF